MTPWPSSALQSLSWPVEVLLAAWLLAVIAIPVLGWMGGRPTETRGILAGVILQASLVAAILMPAWGPVRTLWTVAVVLSLGWLAETIGSHTGFPFGRYAYSDRLQPQIGGVPLLIPVAWLMMLPPAWAIGGAIAGSYSGPFFVLASATAFTAWDLFLDPQMVAWGMWTWRPGPSARGARRNGYFGIPWTNYAGWLGVSALITWVCTPSQVPSTTPWDALILVYALTGALEAFGQAVFWQLRGPALVGALGMGLCLLCAVL